MVVNQVSLDSDEPLNQCFSLYLRQIIERLPNEQRTCLVLYYAGDYTHVEIGERLGCSRETVRQHIHRALINFRKALKISNAKAEQRWLSTGVDKHSLLSEQNTGNGSEQLLNELQVAKMLDVSVATVRRWRYKGGGPVVVRLGGSVRYTAADVAAFVSSCRGRNAA